MGKLEVGDEEACLVGGRRKIMYWRGVSQLIQIFVQVFVLSLTNLNFQSKLPNKKFG